MKTISYFTDGSVKKDKCSCGYCALDENNSIVASNIYTSKYDINYLETMAIVKVFENIRNYGSTDNKYVIYTDSLVSFKYIRNMVDLIIREDESINSISPKNDDLKNLFYNTTLNLIELINSGFKVSFYHIKSHVTPTEQIKYLNSKFHTSFTYEDILKINFGNNLIDSMIGIASDSNIQLKEAEDDNVYISQFDENFEVEFGNKKIK